MTGEFLYRGLLHLYPASWRAEYGEEMRAAFRARRRAASGAFGVAALWLETLPDVVTNAAAVQCDVLRQDLRYAARTLRRSPGFAIAAMAIGAIGIGATTAAFTMVEHVMLRPFPYSQQDRLVSLYQTDTIHGGGWEWELSPANFRDWRQMSHSFTAMEAYRGISVDVSGLGEPLRLEGASVTGGMFAMLGVRPVLGRLFTERDDRDSAPSTVILSYGMWQAEFGGDRNVLGRTVLLDSEPYTVIGVMPKDFYFPSRDRQLWTTLRWRPDAFEDRTDTYIYPIARLKPGVSVERAWAEVRAVAGRLARTYPKELGNVGAITRLLRDDISQRAVLMLKVLMGAALCVLLIACTNLANLLLARAMVRRRELAVRTALGAGRERLVRQMLTESLILSLAGGGLGWLLAHATLPLLVRLIPVSLPLAEMPALDARVLLAATVLVCATGTGFGLIPALRGRRREIATELHEGGRSGVGGRRQRLRSVLVMVEVAGSVVLLVSFGLLTRALWRIQAQDPGFRADHVLTLRTSLPMPKYERPETRDPFYRHVLTEAAQLPGVTAAAYTSFLPMAMRGGIWHVELEGRPEDFAKQRAASLRFVTPGYFSAMKIPLRQGRDVREGDAHGAPYVALVSESFVKRCWEGQNPLGRRINIGNNWRTIIGVVGDVRVRGLEQASEPQVYVSWQQSDNVSPWYAPKDLVVRTAGDPMSLAPALRRIIREADAQQPISEVRSLADLVAAETESRRVQLAVLGAFGAVAFLLAAVGIHSLLAFAVSQRTQEIGVRMALGAQSRDILGMTLRDGLQLALAGIAAGVAVAYGAGQLLESLLAGVKPHDAATFAAAAGLALAMTLAGSLAPAMRAVRVDPTMAIRAE